MMQGTDLINVSCPLCGSDSPQSYARYCTHLFGDDIVPMNLVRCVNCDLIFVSPRPRDNEIEALYGSDRFTADQNKETVGRGRLPGPRDVSLADKVWKVAMLEDFVGGGRLLDIGFGFGAMMKVAEDRGRWEAWGIDPSPASVRFVREVWGLNVQCRSVLEMDFPESCFFAVCMDNGHEHIDRLWRTYLKLFPKEGHPNTYGHIYFYTRKSISILLRKAGFEPRLMLTDQTTFPGYAGGMERVLRQVATTAGKTLPGAGNLLISFGVKV